MSHVLLRTVYCLECAVEYTFYFLYNGANENSSMLCDLVWNLEIAWWPSCIKCQYLSQTCAINNQENEIYGSPFLHWLCCHLSRHVKRSSQWIFFIRNIRKIKHPLTWTSVDLQSRNSSWAIEIVTFASLLMNARRDARLNTTTSETGNTGNTKWRRD